MLIFGFSALFVSVLALVVGGALRDGALVLWGILAAAAMLDAGLSLSGKKVVEFDFPPEVFVGETADIQLTVTNASAGLKGRLLWPEGIAGTADFTFSVGADKTGADKTATATVTCRAVRRGVWAFKHLWLIWPSRFGLFEFVPRTSFELEIRVVPNIRLVQSGQITTTVISTLYGVKENRAIGDGSEFHQLQDFVAGMDVKTIDWKRSARARSLVARELQAERNHHVIIALDNGYLMREEIGGLPRIDHAITAALATAWAAAIGGDLVGYFSYDVRPRTFVAPEPGRTAFARLRSRTADLTYVSRETNHTLAMSELNARTPKRSLIIIFTDFVDTTSAELLVENISILAKRHLVVFVTIRDPDLYTLVARAPKDMDGVATLVSTNQSLSERQVVFERLARLGVTVVDAQPGAVTATLISTYLEIKARELI